MAGAGTSRTGNSLRKVRTVSRAVERVTGYVGVGLAFGVALLTTADVASRFFLNKPFTGTVDITTMMMVALCWLGMALAAAQKRHIAIDLLVPRLPARAQAVIEEFNTVATLFLLALMAWRGAVYSWEAWKANDIFAVLPVSQAPIRLLVSIGAFLVCVELVISLVEQLTAKGTKESVSSGSGIG